MSDRLWGNTRPHFFIHTTFVIRNNCLSNPICVNNCRCFSNLPIHLSSKTSRLGTIFCFVFISTPQYIPARYDPDPKSFPIPKHLYPLLSLSINGKGKIYTGKSPMSLFLSYRHSIALYLRGSVRSPGSLRSLATEIGYLDVLFL